MPPFSQGVKMLIRAKRLLQCRRGLKSILLVALLFRHRIRAPSFSQIGEDDFHHGCEISMSFLPTSVPVVRA